MVQEQAQGITRGTRWSYSSGGALYGVVYNAHYFVLIYYSQVLGLNPGLAGLAVGVGLVFDAITDPLVGYLSDSTQSKWGRRHPWLYASILPLALSFYLIWHPPSFVQGDFALFTYLLVCNVALRTSLTMFLVPAYAIVAEITADYDERTWLLTGFHVFYSILGNGMSLLMYAVWLVPTPEYADGIMNPDGYKGAAQFGTAIIIVSLLIFTIGLQRFIPKFRANRAVQPIGLGQFFREVTDVFRVASARIVVSSGVLYYAGVGTYVVLWVYIYSYFWEFTSQQISLIVIPMALAGLFLPPLMTRLAAGRDKKRVAIIGLLSAMGINIIPITLRLLELFPANGTEVLFWIMLVAGFFETAMFLVFDVSWRSMIADLAERMELETGRRNEGVIASTITFTTKCSDALGTLIAGVLLALIAFPTETAVGEVQSGVVFDLGLIYGPLVFLIWMGAILFIRHYPISREQHGKTLEQLAGD